MRLFLTGICLTFMFLEPGQGSDVFIKIEDMSLNLNAAKKHLAENPDEKKAQKIFRKCMKNNRLRDALDVLRLCPKFFKEEHWATLFEGASSLENTGKVFSESISLEIVTDYLKNIEKDSWSVSNTKNLYLLVRDLFSHSLKIDYTSGKLVNSSVLQGLFPIMDRMMKCRLLSQDDLNLAKRKIIEAYNLAMEKGEVNNAYNLYRDFCKAFPDTQVIKTLYKTIVDMPEFFLNALTILRENQEIFKKEDAQIILRKIRTKGWKVNVTLYKFLIDRYFDLFSDDDLRAIYEENIILNEENAYRYLLSIMERLFQEQRHGVFSEDHFVRLYLSIMGLKTFPENQTLLKHRIFALFPFSQESLETFKKRGFPLTEQDLQYLRAQGTSTTMQTLGNLSQKLR